MFDDLFYDDYDKMMYLMSLTEEIEDYNDDDYIDFDSKSQNEWNDFYGVN